MRRVGPRAGVVHRGRWSWVVLLGGLALAGVPEVAAQNLAEYDYENLGFHALGVDVLYADARGAEGAVGFGFRADLGFLGPNVRVVPRFAFWKSDIKEESITELESNLEEVCVPSGDCTIDLGRLERNYWVLGLDFQWTPAEPSVAPYLGLGLDAYLLDDSGDAIEGTFLEDAVVTAGLSAVGGLEWEMREHLRVYAEARGTLVTSASNVTFLGGVAYRF